MSDVFDGWRHFLNEDSDHYGEKYQKFKSEAWDIYRDFERAYGKEFISRRFDEFSYNLNVTAEDIFDVVGSGAHRNAYDIGQGRIMKIATSETGVKNNRDELELSRHSKFGEVVIQIEETGFSSDNPFWTVSERVEVFENCSEMVFHFEAFRKNEESVIKMAGGLSGLCYVLREYLMMSMVYRATDDIYKLVDFIEDYIHTQDRSTEFYLKVYQNISKDAGKQLRRLKEFVLKNDVDVHEFAPLNTGVNKEGKFVLIDPSVTLMHSTRKSISPHLKENEDV